MRLLTTLLVLASSLAHAQPSETPVIVAQAPAPAPFDPTATISVEPMFLIAGIVEANVEVRVAPHVGLQAIGGYGVIAFTSIKELGTEVNVYLRPQLSGFHVGGIARYMWGSQSFLFSEATMSSDEPSAERELGAYVGWKWIGWKHLTAVLQLGVGHYDIDGKDPVHQLAPVAQLTAGYSF